jgi:hypothetical protein
VETSENDAIKSLVTELLIQLSDRERPELVSIAERLSEIHRQMALVAISMERIAYISPIQKTAHLAMSALLRATRGPQDADQVAEMAIDVAIRMHERMRREASKFGGFQGLDQDSGDADAEESRETIPPTSPDSDSGAALRATG